MAVHEVIPNNALTRYEAHIPTDHMLDQILMQEPALWDNVSAAIDFRGRQSIDAYPFHARFSDEGAAARYLSIVQELSAELLAVSS